MIQISTDAFALLLLGHAVAAWLAFFLHVRQQSRLRAQLTRLPTGRPPEITEPDRAPSFRWDEMLPHARASAPTQPLADLPPGGLR